MIVVVSNLVNYTHLTALFLGLPRWAGTRKVQPIWILLKQETVSGSGISWAICKSAPRSRQITTLAPHHSDFYRPDALPAALPTASKHWRHKLYNKSRTNWRNVCPITQSTHAAAAGLMLRAQQQEPSVDSCMADTKQQQQVNAGSATLSLYVRSWTQTSVDTREDWSSASVVNHTIVTDPTQWHLSIQRGLVVGFCGQSHYCYRPYSMTYVDTERTGRLLLWSITLLLLTLLSDSQVSISLVIRGLWWTSGSITSTNGKCVVLVVASLVQMVSVWYRSVRVHQVHRVWHATVLLTTTEHVAGRWHHGVHVAWLIRYHRNFRLCLHPQDNTRAY